MEEALARMDKLEEATIQMYQADYDRLYLEFQKQRKEDPVFDEEVYHYRTQSGEGIRRWAQMVEWSEEAERRKREALSRVRRYRRDRENLCRQQDISQKR
jgi:hypothetical protein